MYVRTNDSVTRIAPSFFGRVFLLHSSFVFRLVARRLN